MGIYPHARARILVLPRSSDGCCTSLCSVAGVCSIAVSGPVGSHAPRVHPWALDPRVCRYGVRREVVMRRAGARQGSDAIPPRWRQYRSLHAAMPLVAACRPLCPSSLHAAIYVPRHYRQLSMCLAIYAGTEGCLSLTDWQSLTDLVDRWSQSSVIGAAALPACGDVAAGG